MEILKDILKEQEEQRRSLNSILVKIDELRIETKKNTENKQFSIDYGKIGEVITPKLTVFTEKIVECSNHISNVLRSVPEEVELKKVWSIERKTKVFLLVIPVSILIGYFFGPKVDKRIVEYQLEEREKQIQNYRNNNPKTYEKYFK